MEGPILVTGATGAQGGAVVRALLKAADPPTILALTRSPTSPKAQSLASSSPSIKLVQGDLDAIPAIFTAAKKLIDYPIRAVFSVQAAQGLGGNKDEVAQGKGLIDESLADGVKHFVYSSVDRGGEEKSWDNSTNIPHFRTKHEIELHLREKTKGTAMTWTMLRPVAFMDNLAPGMQGRVFLAALKSTFKEGKTLQWIAVRDIGIVAAKVLENPTRYCGADRRGVQGCHRAGADAYVRVLGQCVEDLQY